MGPIPHYYPSATFFKLIVAHHYCQVRIITPFPYIALHHRVFVILRGVIFTSILPVDPQTTSCRIWPSPTPLSPLSSPLLLFLLPLVLHVPVHILPTLASSPSARHSPSLSLALPCSSSPPSSLYRPSSLLPFLL